MGFKGRWSGWRRSRSGCAGNDGERNTPAQEQIVKSITSFALYGFPESHAASFALHRLRQRISESASSGGVLHRADERLADGVLSPGHADQGTHRNSVTVPPIDMQSFRLGTARWEHGAVRLGMKFVNGLRAVSSAGDRGCGTVRSPPTISRGAARISAASSSRNSPTRARWASLGLASPRFTLAGGAGSKAGGRTVRNQHTIRGVSPR